MMCFFERIKKYEKENRYRYGEDRETEIKRFLLCGSSLFFLLENFLLFLVIFLWFSIFWFFPFALCCSLDFQDRQTLHSTMLKYSWRTHSENKCKRKNVSVFKLSTHFFTLPKRIFLFYYEKWHQCLFLRVPWKKITERKQNINGQLNSCKL